MLVVGDLATSENARDAFQSNFAKFTAALQEPSRSTRHSNMISAFIETARIAQGCVDADFAATKEDSFTQLHQHCIAALRAMARAIRASRHSDLDTAIFDKSPFDALLACAPDTQVEARIAEGFAFYALYPEACLDISPDDGDASVVIGIRSIGMALAPMLAEAIGARACFTLRPTGHPFARTCALATDLRDLVRAQDDAAFWIVDEGPALSGTSFMAVTQALDLLGIAEEKIRFVASNPAGPAGVASPHTLERWRRTRKHILDAEPAVRDALGSFNIRRDLSGGAWRQVHANRAAPANRTFERRKFLVECGDELWLAKFTGLGALGAQKARLASALADAKFTPAAGELLNGFLLHRWIADARSIHAAPRAALLARIADYLTFRAHNLAPLPTGGASIAGLLAMTRHNLTQAGMDHDLGDFDACLVDLAALERPVATDNRMHAWEWIVDEHGAILKCDAVDHCAAHDLIGCRDIAWDVAGAIVEFEMDARECADFIAQLHARGVEIAPNLLKFFHTAYCAFQIGAAHMAVDGNAHWPEDAQRWRGEIERYAAALRRAAILARSR